MKKVLLLVALMGLSACAKFQDQSNALPALDIPHTKVVLDNGLTVIVHEDRKTPVVAVNVWYHVGSKNEVEGKTGFAHLFEHLMFNGSENYNDEYFGPFEAVGATGMNGTTSIDRTNYFQTVPSTALDMALWMESDRMGHFLGAVTQERLDEQVEVVLNEKRQGENQPYGQVWNLVSKYSYPKGHPYSWPTIGYYEDINNYQLDDVKAWFKQYYGAANATLVIAGDVDTDAAIEKAKHYFGAIDGGEALTRPAAWQAEMASAKRVTHEDDVPNERLYRLWNVPGATTQDNDDLAIFADYISSGKTSPLYKELVYEKQLATSVSAFVWEKVLGSQFGLIVSAKPGVSLEELEAATNEAFAKAIATTPRAERLDAIRTSIYASAIQQFQRVGGFGGKSHLLAQSQVYSGNPDAWKSGIERLGSVSGAELQATAQRWLHDKHLTISVVKPEKRVAAKDDADRTSLPKVGSAPSLKLPKWQHAELASGLKVVLAERHDAPSVSMNMMFEGGYAADHGDKAGLAKLTMAMLDEGAGDYDALALADETAKLGAAIGSGANLDQCTVGLSTLKQNLDTALGLYADVIQRPHFPAAELERLRQLTLSALNAEAKRPSSMAMRVLPPLLFGEEHAYGQPLTGTGNKAGIESIQVADLQRFHKTWLRPDQATLVVVGDTTMNELQPLLNKHFGDWNPQVAEQPSKKLFEVPLAKESAIYLIDRPAAPQSMIIAGQIAPSRGDERNIALNAGNRVLGGLFTSRLNLNLREDKRWSYGAGSTIVKTKNQRLFLAYASVQSDKTGPSLREMFKEINHFRSHRPITADELSHVQKNLSFSLPGKNETQGEVLGTIATLLRMELPETHPADFVAKTNALTPAQVTEAMSVIQPDKFVWVVVGDLKQIRPQIDALGYDNVTVLPASVLQ